MNRKVWGCDAVDEQRESLEEAMAEYVDLKLKLVA
jgi:hypothetical protein